MRHQRFGRVSATVVVAIAASVVLLGCTGQARQPDSYGEPNPTGEGFYGNFMFGCTGVEPVDGDYEDPTLESQVFCRCVYDGMKETVPFPEAKAFDEAQAEVEPGEELDIPRGIETVRERCADA